MIDLPIAGGTFRLPGSRREIQNAHCRRTQKTSGGRERQSFGRSAPVSQPFSDGDWPRDQSGHKIFETRDGSSLRCFGRIAIAKRRRPRRDHARRLAWTTSRLERSGNSEPERSIGRRDHGDAAVRRSSTTSADVSIIPARRSFQPGITLLQAILAAGGTTRQENRVEISREGADGRLVTIRYNIKQIKSGAVEDPKLQPGDRIEVAR